MDKSLLIKNSCTVLLAGGRGTRIQALFPDTPKPMIEILEKPFIEWVISYFTSQGIKNHIISLGHLAYIAENYFNSRKKDNSNIEIIVEKEPLGTGGAVLFAIEQKGKAYDVFIISNGDSLIAADLSKTWEMLEDEKVDAIIVGRYLDDASRYGTMLIDENGYVKRFSEKKSGSGIINAGIYLVKSKIINHFPRKFPLSMESDVFPCLIEKEINIKVFIDNSKFLDIGTPESIKLAEEFIFDVFMEGKKNDNYKNPF